MTALLLDASAILAGFDLDDDQSGAVAELYTDESITIATLDLARYEVVNVAVRGWRESHRVGTLLGALERIADDGGIVSSDTPLMARAAELADRHEISVYDAAYAVAATGTGRALVSCDVRDLVSNGLAVSPQEVPLDLSADR